MYVCVCVCVRACVRACVGGCVRVDETHGVTWFIFVTITCTLSVSQHYLHTECVPTLLAH